MASAGMTEIRYFLFMGKGYNDNRVSALILGLICGFGRVIVRYPLGRR